METIYISVDDELKQEALVVCTELGFDLNTAITLYLRKLCQERCIPFQLTMKPETILAIENALHGRNLSKAFDSTEELLDDLYSEEVTGIENNS